MSRCNSQHVTSRRTSRRWLVGAAAASTLGLATTACSDAHVPLPSDQAAPEQVVKAYADAVHADDCETAEALVEEAALSWCGAVDITALKVTGRTQERKETESGNGPMIERIWVDLTSQGGDVSLPDGDHAWSYLLDRTGPNGAWRIYDQGLA